MTHWVRKRIPLTDVGVKSGRHEFLGPAEIRNCELVGRALRRSLAAGSGDGLLTKISSDDVKSRESKTEWKCQAGLAPFAQVGSRGDRNT